MLDSKEKKANFKRIASARTDNIVKSIKKLKNLSNDYYYEYTEEELAQITSDILTELKSTMDLLRRKL